MCSIESRPARLTSSRVSEYGTCAEVFRPRLSAAFTAARNSSGERVLSVILTKSTFHPCSRSRAASSSCFEPISRSPGHIDLRPSIFGPEVKMVGPSSWPDAVAVRHSKTLGLRSPAASRTAVMPCARYNGSRLRFSSISAWPPPKWTCMSHSPGMAYLPFASIVWVASYCRPFRASTMARMRLSRTTMVRCGRKVPSTTSTTVASRTSRSTRSAACE